MACPRCGTPHDLEASCSSCGEDAERSQPDRPPAEIPAAGTVYSLDGATFSGHWSAAVPEREVPADGGRSRAGDVLGSYALEETLGAGAFAVVYRARHRVLGTLHAVKLLTLRATGAVRERMLTEAKIQARLVHPHIVAVRDILELDGRIALVMDLIEGPSLGAWLRRHRPDLATAEAIFRGILAGVQAAHEIGIVHRDLKPDNILLEAGTLHPRVSDFGLARGEEDTGWTKTGAVMGTPAYMAPEQIRDSKAVDARADVFSLGCILYELVTGRRAFEGDDLSSLFDAISHGRYPRPNTLVPELPERIEAAIARALAVDRDERPASAGALLALLGPAPDAVAAVDLEDGTRVASQAPSGPEPPVARPVDDLGRALVGRYRLLAVLGRGGMGVVWRAHDPELDREVALKIMRGAGDNDDHQTRRFLQEARAVARLDHRNIVRVFDMGRSGQDLFFTMELVSGPTLAEHLRAGPLVPGEAARIAADIGRALQHAHAQGMVHRDVKPGNVLLEGGATVRVTDFGLVVDIADRESARREERQVVGTPRYMCPEQVSAGEVTPAWDIYSLGAVLYEMLAGFPPVSGGDAMEVMYRILHELPRALSDALPSDLRRVVDKALRRDASERYATMAAFVEDLERFSAGEPVRAAPTTAYTRGRRWWFAYRALVVRILLGLAAATVAVGAVQGFVLWRQRAFEESRESAAQQRLARTIESAEQHVVSGREKEAESLFRGFVDLPGQEGTRALAQGWLAWAAHRRARGDEPAAVAAAASAYAAAVHPTEQGEALLDMARWHWRRANWENLGLTMDLVQRWAPEHARTPEAVRLSALSAAARRDFEAAIALSASEPALLAALSPAIARLRRATDTGHSAQRAFLIDLGADGRDEILLAAPNGALTLHALEPTLPLLGRVEPPAGRAQIESPSLVMLSPLALGAGRVGISFGSSPLFAEIVRRDERYLLEILDERPEWSFNTAVAGDLDGDGTPEIYGGTDGYGRQLVRLTSDREGWSIPSAHPPTDRTNSHISRLQIDDLEGDGRKELLVALTGWGGYDVRALTAGGPWPLRRVARRKVGWITDLVTLSDIGHPGRLVAVSLEGLRPNQMVFPATHPMGEGQGVLLLRGREDGFERVSRLSDLPSRALFVGDLDGDGDEDLASETGGNALLHLRRSNADFDLLPLRHIQPLLLVDLDDDPELEMIARYSGESGAPVWVLGAGSDPLPVAPAGDPSATRPEIADESIAAAWYRAEDLVVAGFPEQAADLLERLAELSADPLVAAQAKFRAASILERRGRNERAATLYTQVAEEPSLRAAALEAAASNYYRDLLLPLALQRTEQRLTLGGDEETLERLRAERDRLDTLVASTLHPLVLRFDTPLDERWQVHDPLGFVRDPASGTVIVDAIGRAPIATLPVTLLGKHLFIEVDLEIEHLEWAGGISFFLRPIGASSRTHELHLGLAGGSGSYSQRQHCEAPDRFSRDTFRTAENDIGWTQGSVRLRYDYLWSERLLCASEHRGDAVWLDPNDGDATLVDGAIRFAWHAANVASLPETSGTSWELGIAAGLDGEGVTRFRGRIRRITVGGVRLDVPVGAIDANHHLAEDRADLALEVLRRSELTTEGQMTEAIALAELQRADDSRRALFAALDALAPGPTQQAWVHRLLRAGEHRFDDALEEYLGPGFYAAFAEAWSIAIWSHPTHPETVRALTEGLAGIEVLPLGVFDDPDEAMTLIELLSARCAAWREGGRMARARQAIVRARQWVESMRADLSGAPAVIERLDDLEAGLREQDARLSVAEGDHDAAIGALIEGMHAALAPELYADRILAAEAFAPLHDHPRWSELVVVAHPHTAWGEPAWAPLP